MIPSLSERFGHLSTGAKMMAIMSLALFPLGLIALLASLHSSRTADLQRRADLRIAVGESARKLTTEIASDVSALRAATNAVANNAPTIEVCARVAEILRAKAGAPTPFMLFGAQSYPVCGSSGLTGSRPSTLGLDLSPQARFGSEGVDVLVASSSGSAVGVLRYDSKALAELARPTVTGSYTLTLMSDADTLALIDAADALIIRSETFSAPLGLLGLTVTISAATIPFGPTEALIAFLPLLMWASASVIAFLLVDRLLIRPLRQLRLAVAGHNPDSEFAFPTARTPAREIEELGETFVKVSRDIADHQARLASALETQTRATREVHHRVKNNLQVVASLISLHARGAVTSEAAEAYAAIQRRVDALAIVHRNHYAELDQGGTLEVRGLIGELASNLRTTAGPGVAPPPISVSSGRFLVTQDTAIAIAFLLTELVELAFALPQRQAVSITVRETTNPGKAALTLKSAALQSSEVLEALLSARYARILEGLSRQLRSPLSRGRDLGEFRIEFPITAAPAEN